jgi:hypothetical protein
MSAQAIRAILPRVIAAVGGVAAIAQAVLPWQQVSFGPGLQMPPGMGPTWNGADAGGGKLILIVGVIVLVIAVARTWRGRAAPMSVLMLGAVALLVGLANFVSIKNDVDSWNSALSGLNSVFALTDLEYQIGTGIYLAIAAGAIAILGGAMSLAMTHSNSTRSYSSGSRSLRAVSGRLAVRLAGGSVGAPAPASGKAPEKGRPDAEQ